MIPAPFSAFSSGSREGKTAAPMEPHYSLCNAASNAAAASSRKGGPSTTTPAAASTNAPTVPDADTHFSLPCRPASGEHFGHDAADRPNMLKEWCGIMYYSCRDVALSGYRKVYRATAAGIKKAASEDEAWSFFEESARHGGGNESGHLWRCHRYYASLATTRACAWMLPGARDAPLVLHIAVLFLGMEAVQATSFYWRYRRAMRETAEAFAEAEAAAKAEEDAEEGENSNNNNDDDDDSVHGDCTGRGGSEASTQRTARTRLPRGSSRALRRLCSYWALIERAVRKAPQKHAGVPTTAAELGRFFGAEETGQQHHTNNAAAGTSGERPLASYTPDSANPRAASDGVPHGAERVLVLSDEQTFPVMQGYYDSVNSANTTTANATAASSVDTMSPLGSLFGGGELRQTYRRGTASPSPPPPPLLASPNASLRHRSPAALPPSADGAVQEIAQPWQVLHALWTDTVRYSVNYTEIRQLLLGCSVTEVVRLYEEMGEEESGSCGGSRIGSDHVFHHPWRSVAHTSHQGSGEAISTSSDVHVDSPLHNSAAASFSAHCIASPGSQMSGSPRYIDGRVSVVCMALTWYLALIREVYEAVVVYQDVQRCAEALEELEEYQGAVYQRGIDSGAGFFGTALRYAQPAPTEAASTNSSPHPSTGGDHNGVGVGVGGGHGGGEGDGLPHSLQLPQVRSTADAEGHDVVVAADVLHSAQPPLLSHEEGVSPEQRQRPSYSNPLAVDSSPTPILPLSRHDDAVHHTVALRGASPRTCWAELTAALAALLRRRRLMELACVRSLFCYMYTGSATKIFSFAVLALLTSLSSRVAALGQASREAISSNLDTYYRASAQQDRCSSSGSSSSGGGGSGGSSACGGDEGGTPAGTRVLALFAFECVRLAVNTVLAKTTQECIMLAASQRRNMVKAELYEALTRMPLAFFDLHSYDEVEQIVYYVNDIEGVEVHVHNYVCGLITSLFAMQHAMRQLPFRARMLVGATVAVSLGVKYVGQRVTTWTQTAQRTGGMLPPWLRGYGLDGTISATAELDAQVEENMESNARQGGVMLRGLDIIAVLPQLRPYAADISLMRWWTDHTRVMGAGSGSTEATKLIASLLVLPAQLYGKMLPALGAALMTFADWVLPTVVSSYGASMAFSRVDALSLSNRLIEAMQCVGDMVDAFVDAHRVAEVVLLNAYKANVLERVLDQRRWEPTMMDFMKHHPFNAAEESAAAGGERKSDANTRECTAMPSGTPTTATTAGDAPDALGTSQRPPTAWSNTSASSGQLHHSMLGKSFRRPSVAQPRPSLGSRCVRRVTLTAFWIIGHSPPVLLGNGVVFVVRKGLCWAGFATPAPRGISGIVGASMDSRARLGRLHLRNTRPKRIVRHRSGDQYRGGHHHHHQRRSRSQTDGGTSMQHLRPCVSDVNAAANAASSSLFPREERHRSGGGSVSDGNRTEAYYSDFPLEGGGGGGDGGGRGETSSTAFPSAAVSFTDSAAASMCSDDLDYNDEKMYAAKETEAAAAEAAAALVNATVYAVTVQNLQFYYPTAPTVPVFPKPISCYFTLQAEEWLTSLNSPTPTSPTPSVGQMRGRLVCLVGPSGHGKSTLLSLLLGMYTHYSTPSPPRGGGGDGGVAAFPSLPSSPLPASSPSGCAAVGANAPVQSDDGDGVDTTSFGSPPMADPSTLPYLPADILVTVRMPPAAPTSCNSGGSSGGGGDSRSISGGAFGAAAAYMEEQLPVSVIPRDILRGNLFSFVPQNPVIFSGATIAHNISLENFISLEQEELLAEISQCAAWARCEYIQRFPQGLMTYIADSGTGAWSSSLASAAAAGGGGGGMVRLSGGQAQRLMMARALFHGRRGGTVLVMDEPTASLDHEVKMEILEEWRALLNEGIVRGMICATHDADLIGAADEVVRLP